MEGLILNFRRSRHRTYGNQMIIQVDGIDGQTDQQDQGDDPVVVLDGEPDVGNGLVRFYVE